MTKPFYVIPFALQCGSSSRFAALSAGLSTRLATSLTLGLVAGLSGCASPKKPPQIIYDDIQPVHEAPARLNVDPPKPVKIVEMAKPLPLPGQLKPVRKQSRKQTAKPAIKQTNPKQRISSANAAARIEPVKNGFINAMQVYPFTQGALYQVYTAPGQITDIALQTGEQLVGSGPVAAGDTVRWIIGDTESGSGADKRIHIMVKPTSPDITTNLVINTDKRTYHLELRSTQSTYMASVSWLYPKDQLIALKRSNKRAEAVRPVATGVNVSAMNFRYAISGDQAPWRPLRAFDDGRQVFIQFPTGVSQGEMPPLFVVGPEGKTSELVNYRISDNYIIVDRLFAAAELRLGGDKHQRRVRISRSDGKSNHAPWWIKNNAVAWKAKTRQYYNEG